MEDKLNKFKNHIIREMESAKAECINLRNNKEYELLLDAEVRYNAYKHVVDLIELELEGNEND